MNSYQLIYLINANLPEEELNSLPKKVNDFILEDQGILDKSEKPVRKKLAYPIKKKEEIFLAVLSFQLAPEKLKTFEKKLKSENEILRYMLLAKKAPKKVIIERTIRKAPEVTKEPSETSKKIVIEEKENKKEELEKIDKKIEEILNTD
ncbi:MAG: 30S ribosomal protein S6 [Patescibacteria group bacterium]|nr:30S ribosomal protein S6 [Patescibacteria group bacterium]